MMLPNVFMRGAGSFGPPSLPPIDWTKIVCHVVAVGSGLVLWYFAVRFAVIWGYDTWLTLHK